MKSSPDRAARAAWIAGRLAPLALMACGEHEFATTLAEQQAVSSLEGALVDPEGITLSIRGRCVSRAMTSSVRSSATTFARR